MSVLTFRATLVSLCLAACGSDDAGQCGSASQCAPGGAAGAAGMGGASGASGTANGGAGVSGAGGIGPSATGGSTATDCAPIGGTPTNLGTCYVSCVFDGSLSPTYDRNGDCTKFGSKCNAYNYCMPNITCVADKNCGAGRVCALGGQCLIACATDADCPAGTGASPLQCKPVDTGTLVCRPYP